MDKNEKVRKQLEVLKANMYNDYAVYRELITLLIQITKFEILENRVNFEAEVIKHLDVKSASRKNRYENFIRGGTRKNISFGASYFFPHTDDRPIIR